LLGKGGLKKKAIILGGVHLKHFLEVEGLDKNFGKIFCRGNTSGTLERLVLKYRGKQWLYVGKKFQVSRKNHGLTRKNAICLKTVRR